MRFKHGLLTAGVAVTLLAGTAGTAFAVGDPSPTHIAASSHVAATKAPTAAYKAISGPGQDGDKSAPNVTSSNAAVPGVLQAAGIRTAAQAGAFTAAHPHGVSPSSVQSRNVNPKTGGGNSCSGACGYEYSTSFIPVNGTETSASVIMSTQEQGTQESSDHFWDYNHALSNLVVVGTCATGNTCAANQPSVEITMDEGQQYCGAEMAECFRAWPWKINGTWSESDASACATVNQPNNGTYHPGTLTGSVTLGYQLDDANQRLDITGNGTILCAIPYSFYGQSSFGPITEESLQTESLQNGGNYGTEPQVSMDYTLSSFTDSAGNSVPAPAVSADYSLSGINSAGWTVSGGRAPSDPTTSWPIELDQDSFACIANTNDVKANGNPIIISNCNTWRNYQAFRYDPTSKEIWYQDGGTGGWCLDDPSNSTANGTALVLQRCTGLTGEKFTVTAIGSAYKQLKLANGVVCINDPTSTNTFGNPVYLYACNTTAAQQNDMYDY